MKKIIFILAMMFSTMAFGDAVIIIVDVPGAPAPSKRVGFDKSKIRYLGSKGMAKRKVRPMCSGFVVKKKNQWIRKMKRRRR